MNGLSPYLGLKTDSSFEMFSNLRTEPSAWNHLLVRETVRLFGYQDQLVRVVQEQRRWPLKLGMTERLLGQDATDIYEQVTE